MRLLAYLLVLFIVVPYVELTLLLALADATNWVVALGLVVLTGIVGAMLARAQGGSVWQRIRTELADGQLPAESLLDGALILVAAALLVTPGMLTDAFGLSLLVPYFRRFYRLALVRWFRRRFHGVGRFAAGTKRSAKPGTIDVEHWAVDDDQPREGEPDGPVLR